MTYSDLHLTQNIKIEILPTDKLKQTSNFFVEGDNLVGVFRPVRTPEFAEALNKFFFTEFRSLHEQNKLSISEAFTTSIHTSNVSQLNYLGNPESTHESGAMVLVVYMDPDNQLTLAQVGDIKLKQRQNGGRFTAQTEDHTFDNPLEVERLTSFLKQSGITKSPESIINTIATDEGFTDKVPSRFMGHPSWCSWGGEYGESFINTQPLVTTFSISTDDEHVENK